MCHFFSIVHLLSIYMFIPTLTTAILSLKNISPYFLFLLSLIRKWIKTRLRHYINLSTQHYSYIHYREAKILCISTVFPSSVAIFLLNHTICLCLELNLVDVFNITHRTDSFFCFTLLCLRRKQPPHFTSLSIPNTLISLLQLTFCFEAPTLHMLQMLVMGSVLPLDFCSGTD